ncbi:ABC transporter ATP-binding protein [uncultured Tateyamaria sp.]|uniref:ABC transporter ATP-binding protein n=1 Tax=uncultured Tateyamaria sp. TaxID=455651 RepID=UPI002617FC36|nr:ABC transporter ATP-binding protein [uncultured Tateyamaria sp.]
MSVLSIKDLSLEFRTFDGVYKAIDRVSIELAQGEALGIVGETGCGKSVLTRAAFGLVPTPPARITGGTVSFLDRDILGLPQNELRAMRGRDVAMIFQDPMTFINPVFKIGTQLIDSIRAQRHVGRREAREIALDMLDKVQLPNPARQMDSYPHQLSGGMRQRILIAMALAAEPKLLIADEPTTALDVTIQAQILDLIAALVEDMGISLIMISHDLGVVAQVCDRIAVMYAGQIVEDAPVSRIFDHPAHPYTKGLLAAVPHPFSPADTLSGIAGALPNLYEPPQGCRFAARCAHASAQCRAADIGFRHIASGHAVACTLFEDEAAHV